MEHKPYPEEHVRSNLKKKQESTRHNSQGKKLKTKERPPDSVPAPARSLFMGKSLPNSKLITNSRQDSTKKGTSSTTPADLMSGSPSEVTTNFGCTTKQQQARIVKKSKPRSTTSKTPDQSRCKIVPIPQTPYETCQNAGGYANVPKLSKKKPAATLKCPHSNECSGEKLNTIDKESGQLIPCSTSVVEISDMVGSVGICGHQASRLTSHESVTNEPNTDRHKVDKIVPLTVCDRINPTICSTELTRKEFYFKIQQVVEKAVKMHQIFLIRGDIPYLEKSMRSRGWVQKYESTKTRMVPYGSVASLDAPSLGNIHLPNGSLNEKVMIFEMLRHVPPDFIWDCRNEFTDWSSNIKQSTLLNRFQKSFIYTSKLGMATILEDARWNYEENVSSVQCPRSYNVGRDRCAFVEDYRMTAAVSLLKWFVEQVEQGVEFALRGSSPISLRQIEFAIKRCEQFIGLANNEHLDVPQAPVSSQDWDTFVHDYIKAVHDDNGFIEASSGPPFPEIEMLYVTVNTVLNKVKEVDPQFELNGYRNIWILKPSDLCCGTGIVMTHKLNHIMKRVQDGGRDYFVVQKYIEKPLLVQATKFDVRQWYLVTKSYPLTIWIYKESFLRFSSRPFSFDNYHEAVHICNTAVQCKYAEQKNSVRAKDWDCEKINAYLKTSGYSGEPWYDAVYPKICQAIIATMLAAQQHMDKRRCSFELYGADFMITNDLSVWLIEINTNPRMHPPSTRVTERLYPEVMESLVKVVLDYPGDPNVDTGNFVLAYQQNVTNFQPYLGASMFVLGKSITQKPKNPHEHENSMNPWPTSITDRINGATTLLPHVPKPGHTRPSFPSTSDSCTR